MERLRTPPSGWIAGDMPPTATPSLWTLGEDGCRHLTIPQFEYGPLDHEGDEQRFLVLHPYAGNKDDVAAPVSCGLEAVPLFDAEPFIAVNNARGYRLLQEAIILDGRALLISAALERFLRHFRRSDQDVRLWIRYICVDQPDAEERARYWTRDFCDTMYALATEVVDMSETVSSLVDQGVIEKVTDSRYLSWSKEWYDVPDQVILPTVYPIRLGKQCSNESPTDDYEYLPLDIVADEIRVLVLTPSQDRSAPIICHVGHCPLHCDVTFMALSYTWGQDETPAMIVLNGQKKRIRKSLEECLRALREPDKALPIWVDAVSINQDDTVERNRQLPRMNKIYERAAAVTSYVGSATPDSELALDLVKELKGPVMRFNDRGEWHFGDWNADGPDGENRISPERLARMCAALYRFFMRPYFRRAWILQELAFASNPTVGVGHSLKIRYEQLDKAAYHLQDMLRSDPSLAGQMVRADRTLEKVDSRELAYVRKTFYFRHLAYNGVHPSMMFRYASIKETAPAMLETLILARDFQTTDPRDKIYALWNLAKGKVVLDYRMDYSKSVRDGYVDFARAWAIQYRSLDIMGAVEDTSDSRSFYESAPSWCPDWSRPSSSSSLVRRERIPTIMMPVVDDLDGELYAADGGMAHETFHSPLFTFDRDVLHCTGVILDQINLVFSHLPEMPQHMTFPRCDPESYIKFQQWTVVIDQHFTANSLTVYDDHSRAATAMLHGDVPAAWLPREENPDNASDRHPHERYVCMPAISRHISRYGSNYNRTDAWDIVKMMIRGRIPFVSENGYMGLVPSYIGMDLPEKPWLLAIIATCSVPLLLQERDDGSYKVCGSCFIQGWMEGEILTSAMGADTPRDFWEAVRDSATLRLS